MSHTLLEAAEIIPRSQQTTACGETDSTFLASSFQIRKQGGMGEVRAPTWETGDCIGIALPAYSIYRSFCSLPNEFLGEPETLGKWQIIDKWELWCSENKETLHLNRQPYKNQLKFRRGNTPLLSAAVSIISFTCLCGGEELGLDHREAWRGWLPGPDNTSVAGFLGWKMKGTVPS